MASIEQQNNSNEIIKEENTSLSELLPKFPHYVTDYLQVHLSSKHLKNNCEYGAKILPEGEGEKPIYSKPGQEIDIAMDAVACTTKDGEINLDTVIVVDGKPYTKIIIDDNINNSSVKGINFNDGEWENNYFVEGTGRKTKPEDIKWATQELQKKD